MDIGVGLPTTVPGVEAADLPGWARQAEELSFSCLGVFDRLVYPSHEPLIVLAAAVAATERIMLATTVLIAPYRGNTALLAKQLADLQQLSRGRLTVGLAAGGRRDDFDASGTPYSDRGRRLDTLIGELRHAWTSNRSLVPPSPYGPPPLLIGGHSAAAMRRAARFGDGWIMGATSSVPYGELVTRLDRQWVAARRPDRPRLMAIAHVALGPGARAAAEQHLRDYYACAGPHAERVVAALLCEETAIRETVRSYEAAGCDSLLFFPCVADSAQLALLRRAVTL
jgi:alkanesulfonate monooxygenase SsuD/methylene tetrahydromethanopterin reductase-like flavin-dependent oxidoreductase (luciferase family)